MLALSIVLNILLSLALAGSVMVGLRFFRYTARFEDSINECLDGLNERYQRIGSILDHPLMYDSPEVKRIMNELMGAQDTILLMANRIAMNDEQTNDNDQEKDTAAQEEEIQEPDVLHQGYAGGDPGVRGGGIRRTKGIHME